VSKKEGGGFFFQAENFRREVFHLKLILRIRRKSSCLSGEVFQVREGVKLSKLAERYTPLVSNDLQQFKDLQKVA